MSQRRPSRVLTQPEGCAPEADRRAIRLRRIGFKSFGRRFVERLARGQPMGVGAYMYVAHRITGLVLTFYLFAHLVVLGSVLSGPDGFNQMLAMTANPLVRVGELVLAWVALFHALNGLRLLVLNLAPTVNQRSLAYGVIFISFGVSIVSLPLFLGVS